MKRVRLWCYLICLCYLTACGSSGSGGSASSSSAGGVASSSSSSVSSSDEASSSSVAVDEACPAGKHIVGYFPSWQGEVMDIQYQYLTHINYSFVMPNADGSLIPMEASSANRLMSLVTMAHGSEVKVGIALGGWNDGDDSAFVALAADDSARARFVSEVVALVEEYQLDGVDMDWEHPNNDAERVGYLALMQDMRAALDELPGTYFLTAAVVGEGDWSGRYIDPEVFELVDFLNLMAYDNYGNAHHSSVEYAEKSIDYWSGRGLSRAKTVIGVPFYSRPTYQQYRNLVASDPDNACRSQVGDDYYNGLPAIRAKAELTQDRACGVMMWELSQDTGDDTSLLKALWETVNDQPTSYLCP